MYYRPCCSPFQSVASASIIKTTIRYTYKISYNFRSGDVGLEWGDLDISPGITFTLDLKSKGILVAGF